MAKKSFIKLFAISVVFWTGIAFLGNVATSSGMTWYKGLILPTVTPSGGVIGAVWTAIFALSAASMAIALASRGSHSKRRTIIAAYVANGILNIGWSVLFFGFRLIGPAFIEAIALEISVIAAIIIVRRVSRPAAALLIPYAVWVAFATYLTFLIGKLNGF